MPPELTDRTVPAHSVPAEPFPETPSAGAWPGALHGRILLADDAPENQRLLAYLLRRSGATVEVVDNGVKALEAILAADKANIPFDLLLTDRDMPRMGGQALATAIRSRGLALPIIALTAKPTPDTPRQMFASGCDDYATKPISEHDLVALCATWLERRFSRHPLLTGARAA